MRLSQLSDGLDLLSQSSVAVFRMSWRGCSFSSNLASRLRLPHVSMLFNISANN